MRKDTFPVKATCSFWLLLFLSTLPALAFTPTTQKIFDAGKIFKSVLSDETEILAAGIIKTAIAYINKTDEPVKLWIIEADLSNPDLCLESIVPHNNKMVNPSTGYKGQDVLEMARTTNTMGHYVIAAVNGGFFVTPNKASANGELVYQPRGPVHIDGHVIATECTENTSNVIGVKYNGEMILFSKANYNTHKSSLKECSGGGVILVENGTKRTYNSTTQEPRTGMGFTGSKLYIILADGRREKYSMGLTYEQMSDIFVAIGTANAINLDGGGSSMMVSKNIATGILETQNTPSDIEKGKPETSVPRLIGNGFAIVARSLTPTAQTVSGNWCSSLLSGNGGSAPAQSLDNQAIYISSGATQNGEAKIYAFHTSNETPFWDTPFDLKQNGGAVQTSLGPAEGSVITSPSGIIYATFGCKTNTPGYLFSIYPNGTKKAEHKMNNGVSANFFQSPPALLPDGNIVVVHRGSGGGVRVIKENDLTLQAFSREAYSSSNVVTTKDNTIYVQGAKGVFGYKMKTDGSLELLGKYVFSEASIGGYGLAVDKQGSLFGAGGTANAARIYAVGDGCKTVKWEYPTTKNLTEKIEQGGIAIGTNEVLYATTDKNKQLLALDKDSGSLKWSYTADGDLACTPAIDNQGHIHVGDMAGNYIILKDNGSWCHVIYKEKLYRNGVPSSGIFASPLISENGVVYVSAYIGSPGESSLFSLSVSETTAPALSSWPMKGGNPLRTGLQKESTNSSQEHISQELNKEVVIYTIVGHLVVECAKNETIVVSTDNGTCVGLHQVKTGTSHIPLTTGRYIVARAGEKGNVVVVE